MDFEGRERYEVLHSLVDIFERSLDNGPIFSVLVAPTGFGKTRIVQEYYRELAKRQLDVYWPADFVVPGGEVGRRQVRHSYSFQRPPSSRLPWMWIAPNIVILPDGTAGPTLAAISALLVAQTPLAVRVRKHQAKAMRSIVRGALSLAPLPDVLTVVEQFKDAGTAAYDAAKEWQRSRSVADTSQHSGMQLGADPDAVFRLLSSLTNKDCKTTIVLDDAHNLDSAGTELVTLIMGSGLPVHIIATAWPDRIQPESETPFARLLQSFDSSPKLRRFEIGSLSQADLARCVLSELPNTKLEVAHALAARADGNPYTLNLLLTTDIARDNTEDASLNVDLATIGRLPNRLSDLLREHWHSLTATKRRCLAIGSALGRTFPLSALEVAVASLNLSTPTNLVDNTWLRFVGSRELVVEFLENARLELASEQEKYELEPWQQDRWRRHLVDEIDSMIEGSPDERSLLVLRSLYLRLGKMGLIHEKDSLVSTAIDLARDAIQRAWSAPAAGDLLESVSHHVEGASAETRLEWHTAVAMSQRMNTRDLSVFRPQADIARELAIASFPKTKPGAAALIEHALCYRADSDQSDLLKARVSIDLAKEWIEGQLEVDWELAADALRADGLINGHEVRPDLAVQKLEGAARIYRESLGAFSYKALVCARDLAFWRRRLLPGSELTDREVNLSTVVKLVGTTDHERAASSMSNLAYSLIRTGDDKDVNRAHRLAIQAVRVRERVYGSEHHLTNSPRLVLSQAWMRQGLISERGHRAGDAARCFVEALALTDRVLGIRNRSGVGLPMAQQRRAEALACARRSESLDLFERATRADTLRAPITDNILSSYVWAARRLGNTSLVGELCDSWGIARDSPVSFEIFAVAGVDQK